MPFKSLALAVAVLASTAGCLAEPGEDAATSSSSDALAWSPDPSSFHYAGDAPTPLDHPEPEIDLRAPGLRPFDVFREPDEWEHNPRSFGCFVRYVVLREPRGTELEVPITVCN